MRQAHSQQEHATSFRGSIMHYAVRPAEVLKSKESYRVRISDTHTDISGPTQSIFYIYFLLSFVGICALSLAMVFLP
jgi:hypothetical protein